MTSYLITYQTRRKDGVGIHQGDWQYKKCVIVAGDDAREAVGWINLSCCLDYDFRLRSIGVIGQVDMIVGDAKNGSSN